MIPALTPGSQTVSDPVSQTVSDPVSQTVSDPISQTVSDPVSQTVCDPGSETVCDTAPQSSARHARIIDEVAGMGGEDIGRVGGAQRVATLGEGHQADAALDNHGVPPRGDDVAEAHPADRV